MKRTSSQGVSRQAGVKTSTVRYYERIGLLPRSKRVNTHRRLDPAVLQTLELIRFAQEAGFTLAEIKVLFQGFEPATPPAARWKALARAKLAEVDAAIARAQGMRRLLEHGLTCGCLRLEDCAINSALGCEK